MVVNRGLGVVLAQNHVALCVLVLVRRRDGGLFDAKGVMPVRVGAAVGAVRRERRQSF